MEGDVIGAGLGAEKEVVDVGDATPATVGADGSGDENFVSVEEHINDGLACNRRGSDIYSTPSHELSFLFIA